MPATAKTAGLLARNFRKTELIAQPLYLIELLPLEVVALVVLRAEPSVRGVVGIILTVVIDTFLNVNTIFFLLYLFRNP